MRIDGDAAAVVLLAVGYPVAIGVISRWVPVVRKRRLRWLVVHHAGVLAIIAGWGLRRPAAVPPNAVWLVVSTLWFLVAGRRRKTTAD